MSRVQGGAALAVLFSSSLSSVQGLSNASTPWKGLETDKQLETEPKDCDGLTCPGLILGLYNYNNNL